MNRRSWLKTSLAAGGGLLVPAGVIAVAGCSATSSPDLLSLSGRIMGTGYSVQLGASEGSPFMKSENPDGLSQQIYAVLKDVDTHMSTWRADSDISVFNNSADTDWQQLSPATLQVIAASLGTSASTGGAFDMTIGPLVDLWGFGSAASNSGGSAKPTVAAIRQTLAKVGHEAVEVDLNLNAVRKHNTDVRLDLSGIAKGHAVDRVASLLDSNGVDSYLVEVGGELRARGSKPDNTQWRVAIERPDAGQRDAFRVVNLEDRAIATSGDYRNFFIDGGQRYSHSIDPRTGMPVTHELASVSVVAASTMTADALSTALMIMGPQQAMSFALNNKLAAHLIVKSEGLLKEHYSAEFESLLL